MTSSPATVTAAADGRVEAAARLTFLPPASWVNVEYYRVDALGSVRAVTNEEGTVIARHDFLPFGEEVAPQVPAKDRKLFTGQERDFETRLDYFNARQLRPDLGRFLTPDPLADLPGHAGAQDLSAYTYVQNNPTGFIDPTGLWSVGISECRWAGRGRRRQAPRPAKTAAPPRFRGSEVTSSKAGSRTAVIAPTSTISMIP